MKRAPEFIRHFTAWLGGYFWLPCPNCGRMFGGHEIRKGGGGTYHSRGGSFTTCPLCPGDYYEARTISTDPDFYCVMFESHGVDGAQKCAEQCLSCANAPDYATYRDGRTLGHVRRGEVT